MPTAKTVTTNFFWRFFERCGAQFVAFFVSIILARLLDPAVYGEIALITVFTCILQVFVDSGLGSALIQKKNADDLDFSSVFYFNIAVCLAMYGVMFFAAPFIADFYHIPHLTPVIRVLSLTLVVSGVRNIQQSYVSKNLIFKKFFFATIGATLCSAVVGVAMAYMGYGVWALVGQQLTNVTMGTIILWSTVKWRPKLKFSLRRLKGLFNYGWKLLASALLDTGYGQLRQLIIGRIYTAKDLAFYNQGHHLPNLIVSNINTSIDSVLLPAMSAEQDDKNRVRAMTRRAISISTFIMMPMMMGLAVCAEPLVRLVLTEKWLPCVPFLRIYCFTFSFWPVHTANLNAIKALGRSDLFLKLEIMKKIIGLTAVLITMNISVMAMAYSLLVTNVISQIINSLPNKKLLAYDYLAQLKDMFPQIALSCIMGGCVYSIQFAGFNDVLTLVLQIVAGIVIYTLLSKLFKIESFDYIFNTILKVLNRKK
ncbi:polysaccharide biosynthesis protein [Fibrobacter succinogenes subsp. succinogenes S85]|uniref:Polysaccharide biosynthesis protein n=1 Tax=Fibrobacter succinogenes (strain ATCC 19169 / S85) TaxID=59374 RepID=C9RMM3_FIBSS|nr:lipopolysaccharide biosynthesis protein [Fibrobacter succinogenes]ACX76255.1 polysaccharide biosynthesis protein [Fibrobacter succinogenes subsp. succinogenes S85]ADL27327.1 polysaccharide biosynthesis protein [Fibrobacter succinogenes subsp. succinogenes S85]